MHCRRRRRPHHHHHHHRHNHQATSIHLIVVDTCHSVRSLSLGMDCWHDGHLTIVVCCWSISSRRKSGR